MSMSTDIEEVTEEQIDAQLEDAPPEGVEVETPDGPVLMMPVDDEINPATDLEGAVLQEQQEAALEYGSEPAVEVEEQAEPANEDAEVRLAIELKMKDLFAEQREGKRLLGIEEKAKLAHTDAKKAREVQDGRIKECIDELEALYLNEPDPARYPLLDKAAVNGMFAKPEAIQPLPADTFAEALRRKQRDTPLASMGLNDSTVKALEALGMGSAFDIVRTFNELGEKGREPGSLKGITANRLAGIATALEKITDECQAEWDAAHPAEDEPLPALVIAPGPEHLVKCNTCGWTRSNLKPGPCPNGHVSGFTSDVDPEEQADEGGE